jgi:uncharacterized protein (DUF1810 family)
MTYDLDRFVDAQAAIYEDALAELRAGRKRTHWMWFVFPQVAGLGASPMSREFAISGLAEARDYLDHPVLGSRLRECAAAVASHRGADPVDIMGHIDALKLHSSMSLFLRASPDEAVFAEVIDAFFDGATDPATDRALGLDPGSD